MQTNITVQYVNEPKPGKKMGSVKTDDGTYYSVKPEMLSQFTQGTSYTVEFSSRNWQGKTFHTIEKIVGDAPSTPQNAPRIVGAPATGDVRSGRIERQSARRDAVAFHATECMSGLEPSLDRVKQIMDTMESWLN